MKLKISVDKPRSHLFGKQRTPLYGKLDTKNLHPEVRTLWYSKDKELPELPQQEEYDCIDYTDQYEIKQFGKLVWKILDTLPPRERKVLISRFEMDLTHEDIGLYFDVGSSRIGQLESRAFRMLKHPSRRGTLFDCVPNCLEHTAEWFRNYNQERQGRNVMRGFQIEKPDYFYSVYILYSPIKEIEKCFKSILPVFEDRFLKDFSLNMLTFKLTDNESYPDPFIFVTEPNTFLAQCVEELLEKELKKHKLGFSKSTHQQTLLGN